MRVWPPKPAASSIQYVHCTLFHTLHQKQHDPLSCSHCYYSFVWSEYSVIRPSSPASLALDPSPTLQLYFVHVLEPFQLLHCWEIKLLPLRCGVYSQLTQSLWLLLLLQLPVSPLKAHLDPCLLSSLQSTVNGTKSFSLDVASFIRSDLLQIHI